jgi:hypothetical protein
MREGTGPGSTMPGTGSTTVGKVGDARPLVQLRGAYLVGHRERPLEPAGQQGRSCCRGLRHDGHGTRQQPPRCCLRRSCMSNCATMSRPAGRATSLLLARQIVLTATIRDNGPLSSITPTCSAASGCALPIGTTKPRYPRGDRGRCRSGSPSAGGFPLLFRHLEDLRHHVASSTSN